MFSAYEIFVITENVTVFWGMKKWGKKGGCLTEDFDVSMNS
jgi:hypothetical protein